MNGLDKANCISNTKVNKFSCEFHFCEMKCITCHNDNFFTKKLFFMEINFWGQNSGITNDKLRIIDRTTFILDESAFSAF